MGSLPSGTGSAAAAASSSLIFPVLDLSFELVSKGERDQSMQTTKKIRQLWVLLAGHACDRFFSKPSALPKFHFPLSSRCNHGGISDGAAGAVPGLPPGRGTFVNDVIMLVVAVVTAARGLHVATSDALDKN